MENASKALIIAGAILLAILLISLGIYIFGQAQDTVSNSGMSQAELTTFNSKFSKYEGNNNVKGSSVRSLIQEVIANNSDDNNIDNGRTITIEYVNKTDNSKKKCAGNYIKSSYIKSTATYTVECETDSGRINNIKIIGDFVGTIVAGGVLNNVD